MILGCQLPAVWIPCGTLEFNRAVEVGDVRLCFLQNKATGARRAVLPPDVKSVCTLIFGFDEGSIGSAGVAAAAFQQKTTVWARFDSIDRVIRDLKFVESGCCG